MTLDEAKEIMREAGTGFLATTDGERPAVRPMAGWSWVGAEIWTATGAESAKCADIARRPDVEYSFLDSRARHVRIAGTCRVSASVEDKQALLAMRPEFEKYTGPADSPDWVVLRLLPQAIRVANGPVSRYEDVSVHT